MADELTVTGWCAQQEEAFTYVSVDLGSVRRVKAIMVKGVVTNDVVSRPTEIRVFFSNKIRSNQEFRRLLPQFQPDVPRSGQLRRAGHDHPTSVRPSASRNSTICADRRWAWSLTCPSRLPAPSCRLCWTWPPPTFRAASTARLESRPSVEPRTAVDECVLPVCGFGTYSPTGLVPCLQCPRNSFTGTPPPGRLPANGNHWTSLPDVTWYLNGHQMLDDATHKILANESGNHALMITGAGLSDSGVIQCVARNKGGEARFQVRLSVIEREQVVAPKSIERFATIYVKEGEPVSLNAHPETDSGQPKAMRFQKPTKIIQPETECEPEVIYLQSVPA